MLLSEDGHLDIAEALRRIQRAGVRPSIKGVVVMIQITLLKSEISLDRSSMAHGKVNAKKMVPVISSGKYITATFNTDDGRPIEDASIDIMRDSEVMFTSFINSNKKNEAHKAKL
ncbi:hypothetical protein G4B88_005280 [Cannabis sativa]|uniref:Uncharacterized protein n=1 Tax=Cannabis sativa TaxID=3483 RepID=A0A7J6HBL4_CANSA|nr:hypothetical protein G4B88_005280 [Cannabis sativa]